MAGEESEEEDREFGEIYLAEIGLGYGAKRRHNKLSGEGEIDLGEEESGTSSKAGLQGP